MWPACTRSPDLARAPRPEGFRPDIEGLRAIAVLLVLVYHAGLPFLPHGFLGVDVFFVISGYLITGLLLRELAATGSISWPRFVARRARRLLPAAILVLVAIAVSTWFLVPGRRGREIGGDAGRPTDTGGGPASGRSGPSSPPWRSRPSPTP